MRPANQPMSPLLWAVQQLGRFLGDGYREIRNLLAANTPQTVRRVFTGSLAALVLALVAVAVIGSQLHPAVAIIAVACVVLIAYGRTLLQRLALFGGYFLCGFVIFVGAGLIIVTPIEKAYPLLAKAIAVALFALLCLVIPALLTIRRHQLILVGGTDSAESAVRLRNPTVKFSDLGGLEDAKRQIREIVESNLRGQRTKARPIVRNGILLHGPRGTGKTYLAEAVAGEFRLNFLHLSGSDLHHKYVGESEQHIEMIFQEAAANAPALLFIDEIDAVGATRQVLGEADDTGGAARGYNSATIRLMSCIDKARKDPGLILLAATNSYDGLDRALIRDGRFDLHIRMDLPNEPEREQIFGAQLAKHLAKRFALEPFAKRTPGWSAAKIAGLVDRAALLAAGEHRHLEEHDLAKALMDTGGRDRAAFREVDWPDIVLARDTEADLRDLIKLMDPGYADRLKLAMPTGLLLVGPPGTGKTMIARLIATQTKRSFYPITAADILGGAAGASVKKLREVFSRARENSPSIIFIDEVDGLLPRNTGIQSQHDIQLVEQARTLISELEPNHNVFLIGTTNHIDNIDPAILRGGRFSEKIEIGVPHEDGYRRLIARHIGESPLAPELTVDEIANKLKGISPADLEAICTSAKRMAMRRMADGADRLPPLIWTDFTEAMKRVQVQF